MYRLLSFFSIATITFGCSGEGPTAPIRKTSEEFRYSLNGIFFDENNYGYGDAIGLASIKPTNRYVIGSNGIRFLEIILTILSTPSTPYQEVTFEIPITNPVPGSFTFTGQATDAFATLTLGNSAGFSSKGGVVVITKFDTINNLVSGTFNFDAVLGQQNDIEHIASGFFNDITINIGSFGQGTVSATIDGEAFSTISGLSTAGIYAGGDNQTARINAYDGSTSTRKELDISISTSKPGDYIMSGGGPAWGAFSEQVGPTTFISINTAFTGITGNFTLTKFDTLTHRLSGTFDFSGFDSTAGKTIHVANGVIDNVRWIVH